MPIPDFQTLMLPVLRACNGRERHIREIASELAQAYDMTPEERADRIPSGLTTRFDNRVGWAKTYLKQAGLLSQPRRGVVAITERGRQVLAGGVHEINMTFLERFPEYLDFKKRTHGTESGANDQFTQAGDTSPKATPEEQIDAAASELAAALRLELIARITTAPPAFFEDLVIDLMLALGYGGSREDAAERLGRSGDGGVDGVIREDRLGLDRIYLQAKRYQTGSRVGRPAVQEFIGALHGQGAQKGVFITTSEFTADARAYVTALGPIRVVLIDGEALASLMIQHGVGVRTYRQVDIKRVDIDYFENAGSDAS